MFRLIPVARGLLLTLCLVGKATAHTAPIEFVAAVDQLDVESIGVSQGRLYGAKQNRVHRWESQGWRELVDTQNRTPEFHTSRGTGRLYATGDRVLWRLEGDGFPVVARFGGAVRVVGSARVPGTDLLLLAETRESRTSSDTVLQRFDGSALQALPDLFAAPPSAAIDDAGRVYALGSVRDANGQGQAMTLRRWADGQWMAIGGLDGITGARIAWDGVAGRLLVAGDLTVTATGERTALAAWDGEQWRPLAASAAYGVDTPTFRMETAADGAVYLWNLESGSTLGRVEATAVRELRPVSPRGVALDASTGELYLLLPDGGVSRLGTDGTLRAQGLRARFAEVHPDDARDRLYVLGRARVEAIEDETGLRLDGGRWSPIGLPPGASPGRGLARTVDPADGSLVYAEADPSRASFRLWRFDGAWRALPLPPMDVPTAPFSLIVRAGRAFVRSADGATAALLLFDGAAWQRLGGPAGGALRSAAWGRDGVSPTLAVERGGEWWIVEHAGDGWRDIAAVGTTPVTSHAFDPRNGALVFTAGSVVRRQSDGALRVVYDKGFGTLGGVVATASGVVAYDNGVAVGLSGSCRWVSLAGALQGVVGTGGTRLHGLGPARLERQPLPPGAGQGLRVDVDALVLDEGGPDVPVDPSATLCTGEPPPQGVDVTLVGGGTETPEELRLDRLTLPATPGFEGSYDAATRTLRIRAAVDSPPDTAQWQAALRRVTVGSATTGLRFDWNVRWTIDSLSHAPATAVRSLRFNSVNSAPRVVVGGSVTGVPSGTARITVLDVSDADGVDAPLTLRLSASAGTLAWAGAPGVRADARRGETGLSELTLSGRLAALSTALRGGALGLLAPAGQTADVLVDAGVVDADGAMGRGGLSVVFRDAFVLQLRPDQAVVRYGGAATSIDVLANDLFDDAAVAASRLEVVRAPRLGAVAWETRGTPTPVDDIALYTPRSGLSGADRFSYRLCAAGACREADVHVDVGLAQAADTVFATADRGFASLGIGSWLGWTDARYDAFGPVAVETTRVTAMPMGRFADFQQAVAAGTPVLRRILPADGAEREWRLHARFLLPERAIDLYVGIDDNGNGRPDLDEVRCAVVVEDGLLRDCSIGATQAANRDLAWWALAVNRRTEAAMVEFETGGVAVTPTPGTAVARFVATGPATLPRRRDVRVGLTWNRPAEDWRAASAGWVRVSAADGEVVGWKRVDFHAGNQKVRPHVLPFGREYRSIVRFHLGDTSDALRLEVPAGARRVSLAVRRHNGVSVTIDGPTRVSRVRVESLDDVLDIDRPLPGRYVVNVRTIAAQPIELVMRADIDGDAPVVRSGGYFNPSRPGSGLFIYPAGNQWAGLWYAYDALGQPTWYYVQADAPPSHGVWRTTVFRSTWAQGRNRLTAVGELVVTPLASDRFAVSFLLEGRLGREEYVSFGRGCPTFDGLTRDASGLWFDPRRSGTGYSVQLLPGYEFLAFFAYDAWGEPRFLVAERGSVGGAVDELPLEQLRGTPPSLVENPAPSAPPQRIGVGMLRRTFTASGLHGIDVLARFAAPLEGEWAANDAVALLGPTQGCVP